MRAVQPLLVGGLILSLGVIGLSASARAAPVALPMQVAPASEGAFISATGVGVSVSPADRDLDLYPQTLFVGVETSVQSSQIADALRDMTAKVGAIRTALLAAGVADSAVRMQNLAVYPAGFGQKATTPPQPVATYTVVANLQVDVPTVRLLVSAMEAARGAGATQVSSGGKGGLGGPQSVQPAPADLDVATAAALANARANAEAIAKASGKTLGALHSISAVQPSPDCCPPGAGWRIQLTVTFEYR